MKQSQTQRVISKTIYWFLNMGVNKFSHNGVAVIKNHDYFILRKGTKTGSYIPKEEDTVKTVANALAKIIEEIQ